MENKVEPKITIPTFQKYDLNSKYKELHLVTSVIFNNTEYYLYSNGKLYTKNESEQFIELDDTTEQGRKLIKEIMNMFKAGKTDIYMK